MYFTRDGRFVRTDIWREGKYLDLWSVPHFLSGMSVGFALYFFRFEPTAACIIAFLLFVAYEMFEVIAEIEETRWNRTLDVVVGMISFIPTYFIAPRFDIVSVVAVFAVVVVIDVILSFNGWRASQKAVVLEIRLRAEFERERARVQERHARLKDRWKHRRRWQLGKKKTDHPRE